MLVAEGTAFGQGNDGIPATVKNIVVPAAGGVDNGLECTGEFGFDGVGEGGYYNKPTSFGTSCEPSFCLYLPVDVNFLGFRDRIFLAGHSGVFSASLLKRQSIVHVISSYTFCRRFSFRCASSVAVGAINKEPPRYILGGSLQCSMDSLNNKRQFFCLRIPGPLLSCIAGPVQWWRQLVWPIVAE